ncbi:hypothetical protein DL769_011224 [Monosporascus sp. CRB-8-3]|nr:hypothetical protein DL769_011224 [Monosporascus sp. CRB-8-3]
MQVYPTLHRRSSPVPALIYLWKPDTWAYFEVKQLDADMRYQWYKMNIFIRWLASTRQTIILAFDTQSPIAERIPYSLQNPDPACFGDPFWVYARLTADVVDLQDTAVWAIRNRVRAIETERKPEGKPQPDYRHLHDIARHAIHVSETLNVATDTMEGILLQHDNFLSQSFSSQTTNSDISNGIHRQLLFHKDMIRNLRHRSFSNRERLQNEIQLAFNTVAQYDAGISVQIGRAAQLDGAAMKTVAFLTITFLPATFLSAVFSMSFFHFEPDSDSWSISSKIWIYWAFANMADNYPARHTSVQSSRKTVGRLDADEDTLYINSVAEACKIPLLLLHILYTIVPEDRLDSLRQTFPPQNYRWTRCRLSPRHYQGGLSMSERYDRQKFRNKAILHAVAGSKPRHPSGCLRDDTTGMRLRSSILSVAINPTAYRILQATIDLTVGKPPPASRFVAEEQT